MGVTKNKSRKFKSIQSSTYDLNKFKFPAVQMLLIRQECIQITLIPT